MPDQAQTPASKRFIQPSSSYRPPQSSSKAWRTQHAPPTQPTSSSPFLRTPFSGHGRQRDDIEVSFDEQIDLTSFATANRAPQLNSKKGHDHTENYNKTQGTELEASPAELRSDITYNVGTELAESNAHEVELDFKAQYSSPLPKRQKVLHVQGPSVDPIDISSSSENDAQLSDLDLPRPDQNKKSSDHVYQSSLRNENEQHIEESHSARPRFKIAAALDTDIKHDQRARGFFMGRPTGELDTPLPATFSPSRRKGRHDYVLGGAAETVRNWVLDVANAQSQATDGNDQKLSLNGMTEDVSGRYELATDESDRTWMLVHQEGQIAPSRNSIGGSKGRQQTVVLKGVGTTWNIDLNGLSTEAEPPGSIGVAVLWDKTF